jgi:hypothetical protein
MMKVRGRPRSIDRQGDEQQGFSIIMVGEV